LNGKRDVTLIWGEYTKPDGSSHEGDLGEADRASKRRQNRANGTEFLGGWMSHHYWMPNVANEPRGYASARLACHAAWRICTLGV